MAIRHRNDPVRLFGRRLLLLGLFVLVIAGGAGVWRAFWEEQESTTLNAQAQVRLANLELQQTQLSAKVSDLETERGQEAVLRDQYALAAQGEHLVVIVDSTATQPEATSSAFAAWLHNTFPWW